jgi:hypothetical protein
VYVGTSVGEAVGAAEGDALGLGVGEATVVKVTARLVLAVVGLALNVTDVPDTDTTVVPAAKPTA